MKKYIVTVISAVLSLGLMITPAPVLARKSINALKSEKSNLQQKLSETDSDLVETLSEIELLETEISEKKQLIKENEKELDAARKAEAAQRKRMKARIKYLYENDTETIISILASSESYSDFINRIYYSRTIQEYDRELFASYDSICDGMAAISEELEMERTELENDEVRLKSQKNELDVRLSALKRNIKETDKKLVEAKEEARKKAEEKRKAREREKAQKAAAAAAEAAKDAQINDPSKTPSVGSVPSSGNSSPTAAYSASTESNPLDRYLFGTWNNNSPSAAGQNLQNNTSALSGAAVIEYAKKFVGNPYVWGGNSLTEGCDCSGFVVQIYKNFGIDLSETRNSTLLRDVGRAVTLDDIQLGDIVCYSGHVALYAGNGQIVEAQSSRAGITLGRSVTCKDIITIRRII